MSPEIIIQSGSELEALLAHPNELKARIPPGAVRALAVTGGRLDKTDERALPVFSRLPRKVQADDDWLHSVRRAVKYAVEHGWTVIASSDGLGWEYTAWYAARTGVRLWMVLPPGRTDRMHRETEKLVGRLKLNPIKTTFLMPVVEEHLSKPDRLHLRDLTALALAHHRLPVVIRSGGFWEGIINEAKGVDRSYITDYPARYVEAWRRDQSRIDAASGRNWGEILVHWTRGVYGPWPGEVEADYFEALTATLTGNPRDGLATLNHIAASGLLRGRGRIVRGGTPVISFTALAPDTAVRLADYRPALGRWTFEPYGIALTRSTLTRLGARPVIYGTRELYTKLSPQEQPFYQYRGPVLSDLSLTEPVNKTDPGWEKEMEWRLVGDIDLLSLKDEVLLIAPTEIEADELRGFLPFKVASLEKGPS